MAINVALTINAIFTLLVTVKKFKLKFVTDDDIKEY